MAESRLIQKQLAGKEDLLLGVGTVSQARATGVKTITKLNATHFGGVLAVDTINNLNTLDKNQLDEQVVFVKEDGNTYIYNGTSWVAKTITVIVDTIADLKNISHPDNTVWVSGYHTKNDGAFGSHIFRLKGVKTTETDNGGTVIIATIGGVEYVYELQYDGAVNVKWFGVKGDFNPTSGTGTDDRETIQKIFDYVGANGIGEILFPSGNYFLNSHNPINSYLGNILVLGSLIEDNAQRIYNVSIIGINATFYAGLTGRMLTVANAERVSIDGLKFVHTTKGIITANRGNTDYCIRISDSSRFITIKNCYLTNFLGWGIDIVTRASNPSAVDYICSEIVIKNNIIKTRVGNGTRCYSGGNGGAWVIAIITGKNIKIYDNVLYGDIDIENNSSSQVFENIVIESNNFYKSNVIGQSSIGTEYWHDEILDSGTSFVSGGVQFRGVGLDDAPENIKIINNNIEYGLITASYSMYRLDVVGNSFKYGRIELGAVSGTDTFMCNIESNKTFFLLDDNVGFINILSRPVNSTIRNNTTETGYCLTKHSATLPLLDCEVNNNIDGASTVTKNLNSGQTTTVTIEFAYDNILKTNFKLVGYGGLRGGNITIDIVGMLHLNESTAYQATATTFLTSSSALSIGSIVQNNTSITFTITNNYSTASIYATNLIGYSNISFS